MPGTDRTSGQTTPFRQQVHALLRESILDAAWNRAMDDDWERVRIGDIAGDVGVSRQTIHNEFGTKQQLAEAMFDREMQSYVDGIIAVTREAETLEDAVRSSLVWLFDKARSHEMLVRMLVDAREGRSTALLPLLTTNAYRIVRPLRDTLSALYDERWPGELAFTQRMMDFVLRLSLSHLVLASDFPEEEVVDDLVGIVLAVLRDHARQGQVG